MVMAEITEDHRVYLWDDLGVLQVLNYGHPTLYRAEVTAKYEPRVHSAIAIGYTFEVRAIIRGGDPIVVNGFSAHLETAKRLAEHTIDYDLRRRRDQ